MIDKIAALKKIAIVELWNRGKQGYRPTSIIGKSFQSAMDPVFSIGNALKRKIYPDSAINLAGRKIIDRYRLNGGMQIANQNKSQSTYSYLDRYIEDPTKFKESIGIPQVRQITPYESIPEWKRNLSKEQMKNISHSAIGTLNGGSVWPAFAQAKSLSLVR